MELFICQIKASNLLSEKNIKGETKNKIQFNFVFYQQQEQTKIHLSFENKIMSVHISKENCSSKYIYSEIERCLYLYANHFLFSFNAPYIQLYIHRVTYVTYVRKRVEWRVVFSTFFL